MWTIMRIVGLLAALLVATDAVPYSKYGRTCKDIGCLPSETCVMAEDPCTGYGSDSCGRYPTCTKSSKSCTTIVCPAGQYCKTQNGQPTCVSKDLGPGFDSAGVSSVNGQQVPGNKQPSVPADPSSSGSRYASSNPYSNANAPPADEVNSNAHPSYGNNPAYPPYPTNNNNNGYPPYPGGAVYPPINSNNNRPGVPVDQYGYPQYPTNSNNNNRPGAAVDQYGYPIYPSSQPRPDNRHYNTYPQHNLPQHNPGWGNTYPNSIYRKSGASSSQNPISLLLVLGVALLTLLGLFNA